MTTDPLLRVGVIGAGGRGTLARIAHQPDHGSVLAAGADILPSVLDEFHRTYPDAFVTTDYRELLRLPDIDAVFVTSPDFLHEEHAVAALDAGKAVYLEKPMAITIPGCDRILQAAMRNRCRLYLGHNMRHMAFVAKMKELVDAGAIGQVKTAWCRHFIAYGGDAYFKDWHAERTKATSLLLQKAAHDIDVLHWLCGGYTSRVSAMGALMLYDRVPSRRSPDTPGDASWHVENWPPMAQKNLNPVIDVEDVSCMLMQLENGVIASYQQCHFSPDAWRNYTIVGSEGRVENFGDVPGDCSVRLWNRRCSYSPDADATFPIPHETGTHGGADPRIVAEFLRYARQGGPITTSPVAARNSVAAGCCATHSLRNGSIPMDVPPLPADVLAYFEREVAGQSGS